MEDWEVGLDYNNRVRLGRDIRISNQFLITRAQPQPQPHILHSHKRIIKQASLSHWVAEYNLKVSSVVVQNGEYE